MGPAIMCAGSGDDRGIGSAGPARISGGGGNDFVEGWGSDDRIRGGSGRDRLHGQGGADDLVDQECSETYMSGGAGDDSFRAPLCPACSREGVADGVVGGDGVDGATVNRSDVVELVDFYRSTAGCA